MKGPSSDNPADDISQGAWFPIDVSLDEGDCEVRISGSKHFELTQREVATFRHQADRVSEARIYAVKLDRIPSQIAKRTEVFDIHNRIRLVLSGIERREIRSEVLRQEGMFAFASLGLDLHLGSFVIIPEPSAPASQRCPMELTMHASETPSRNLDASWRPREPGNTRGIGC